MGKHRHNYSVTEPGTVKDRQRFLASILCRPLLRVLSDYQDEIRAKDQAYRFILERDLMDEFQEFCQGDQTPDPGSR